MINDTQPNHFYIIDDDPIFQFTIKKHLSLIIPGIQVSAFKNGQEALDAFQKDRKEFTLPDIIILDIHMPVLNGWRFLQAIEETGLLKANASVDIYLVSCVLYQDDWRRAKNSALVKEFIMKPVSGDKLITMINTLKL